MGIYIIQYFTLIALFYLTSSQNVHTNTINEMSNEIDGSTNDELQETNPIDNLISNAASFLQNNGNDGGSNLISNLLQSDGGKTVENLIMGTLQNQGAASDIFSTLGSIFQQNNAGAALDPSLIGNVLSLMASNTGDSKKSDQEQLTANMLSLVASMMAQKQKQDKDDDMLGTVLSTVSNVFTDSGENPISLLTSSLSSFFGPEAAKRKNQHASHEHLLPPILEKAHLYFDHFKNTELYKALWRITGADKIFQKFADGGKFNFAKFFDLLENKNFRKHWIHVVTKKIATVLSFVTDSSRYKKYVNTAVSLFNGFLKSLDFPKSTLFDITRPDDTLTKLLNYFFKRYLSADVNSSPYVKPAVKYIEEILRLAHVNGLLFKDGFNSKELAQKLTDTLNLEIIEPILRVWRAYRFAKKVPECDKYVMCLINQDDPTQKVSLPGLKQVLSKTASMFASWFLSEKTKTSFWTLYSTINDETDCSIRFLEKCNDFHDEETKVDSEYVHTEL